MLNKTDRAILKEREEHAVYNFGKYQLQLNGVTYQGENAVILGSIFEFDGDKPLNEGCPIRNVYFAEKAKIRLLSTEQDIERILAYPSNSVINIQPSIAIESIQACQPTRG